MKKPKTVSTLFSIAAFLFFLAAIIGFASEDSNSTAFIWLSLGSTFLCLGTTFSRKAKDGEEEKKSEE